MRPACQRSKQQSREARLRNASITFRDCPIVVRGWKSAAGDQPKSLDCLQVFVTGSDSVMRQSTTPIRVRVLHLVLKNICSDDVTAFALKADIKSPVAQQYKVDVDMVYKLHTASPADEKIPLAGRDFPCDLSVPDDPAGELPFGGAIKAIRMEETICLRKVRRRARGGGFEPGLDLGRMG